MNTFELINLAMRYGPMVVDIVNQASSNDDIVTKLQHLSKPLADVLENVGGELFPQAKPQLHIAAGAIAAFNVDYTKWLQATLNAVMDPSPNLKVDGLYGPRTKAAVTQFQTQLGLTADGWAGKLTQAALEKALG